MEDCESAGLNEGDDHVEELLSGAVPPVVGLQRPQHLTGDLRPDELLGVMKAGLDEVWEIVMLSSADETRDGEAGERTAAGVEIVQQDLEGVRLELNDVELGLEQFVPVNLLGVSADTELGQSHVGAV